MNIAIVTSMSLPLPAVKGGGVEWLIQTIIDQNEKYGNHHLTIIGIADEKAKIESLNYRNAKFIFIPYNRMFYKYYGYIKKYVYHELDYFLPYIKYLRKYFKKNNFDKIIFENNFSLTKCLSESVSGEKIFHLHNDTINRYTKLPDSAKFIDKVFCVSRFIRNQVIENGFYSCDKVFTLPNCNCMPEVKIDDNQLEKLKKQLKIFDDSITFLYSGRLIREKGVLELIKSFCNLDRTYNMRLIIVGGINYSNNEENSYLKELKREADDRVVFTGYIPYEQIHYYYSLSDVSIIPTLYVEDAAPLVAIESMMAGLAIIASDSGGIWDFVTEDCGIQIKRNDSYIYELSKAISYLAERKDILKQMGVNSGKNAKRFSKEKYFENFNSLLKSGVLGDLDE